MNTVELLKAAKAVIEKEENWTQNAYARNAEGEKVAGDSSSAVCWCSLGAFDKVSQGAVNSTWTDAVGILSYVSGDSIATFNDSHTHAQVMVWWDEAIAEAERRA